MKYLFITLLFLFTFGFANTPKILFISSYNSSFPTIPKQIMGIKKVLPESKYQIDIEYMDTKRVDPKEVESVFLSSLLLKQRLLAQYDAVLVGDDNALHFVHRYQNKLFLNKPIIFLAINNESFAKDISMNRYITGVIEKQSVTETINIINKFHPKSEKIVVIADATTTSDGILKSFSKNDLLHIEILSLKDYTYKELAQKLKTLSTKQPLLYVSAMADKSGLRKDFYESIDFIKSNANLPLYHLYEHGIGEGMIGGKVVMFSKQGEIAAEMVERVLKGVDIQKVDYIPESKNNYLFDYQELVKYDIDETLLPSGSIVINKPVSFLKENFELILQTFTLILLVMFIAIVILLIKANKRSMELEHITDNLKALLNLQDNIVTLSDGNELNFANQKFFDFLGFKDLESFKEKHKSMSELFIENERFFHLGKIKEGQNWAEVIQTLPHTQRIVSILGNDFKPHAFSVAVNRFNDKLFIFNFSDISQTMLKNIELELKTIHDKLTGAYNREYFEQTYSILLTEYEQTGYKLGLALIDIDHFKIVNDTYGHDVGDEVLKHFVDTIHKYSRSDDIFIRWGGEEFILILKVKTKDGLHRALEHLRKTIEIQNFPIIGQKTCSIGGTLYKENEDIDQTIKRADKAVYEAKATGRNKVLIK